MPLPFPCCCFSPKDEDELESIQLGPRNTGPKPERKVLDVYADEKEEAEKRREKAKQKAEAKLEVDIEAAVAAAKQEQQQQQQQRTDVEPRKRKNSAIRFAEGPEVVTNRPAEHVEKIRSAVKAAVGEKPRRSLLKRAEDKERVQEIQSRIDELELQETADHPVSEFSESKIKKIMEAEAAFKAQKLPESAKKSDDDQNDADSESDGGAEAEM